MMDISRVAVIFCGGGLKIGGIDRIQLKECGVEIGMSMEVKTDELSKAV